MHLQVPSPSPSQLSPSQRTDRRSQMQGLRYDHPSFPDAIERRRTPLSIDAVAEPPERRVGRVITENPVVIFSRRSCCMCHVMRRLLEAVGAHPTVIELEEGAGEAAAVGVELPAAFVGGEPVGGIEGLVGMHLGGRLVPRLVEVGAISRG